MSFSFFPDYKFKRTQDITPAFLQEAGISLLMLDLDNTLAPYGKSKPAEDMILWCDQMRQAGITLYIVSNNRSIRPEIFSDIFGIPYVHKAGKPFTHGVKKAIRMSGFTPQQAALCGDQIYTDILAAHFAGICGILVAPIRLWNPLHLMRYLIELPFRWRVRKQSKSALLAQKEQEDLSPPDVVIERIFAEEQDPPADREEN